MFMAVVYGPSMAPTLRHGDVLVVRRGGRRTKPGDVVVARFAARPELLVVKRALWPVAGGWWVRSDNSLTSDDSRAYGTAEVIGRVWLRCWPRPGRLRGPAPLPPA
jgi:phage repressor protein C with HTH and peptisase S24 domain